MTSKPSYPTDNYLICKESYRLANCWYHLSTSRPFSIIVGEWYPEDCFSRKLVENRAVNLFIWIWLLYIRLLIKEYFSLEKNIKLGFSAINTLSLIRASTPVATGEKQKMSTFLNFIHLYSITHSRVYFTRKELMTQCNMN